MNFRQWKLFEIQNLLKYVLKGPIDKNLALVLIMAWCRTGDKPLSEQMMALYNNNYSDLNI